MTILETLRLNHDPFAPGSPVVLGEPVKAAFAQIVGEVGCGARVIVIGGSAGTGKTLLLTLVQDFYKETDRGVSRVGSAALLTVAVCDEADLLLVDEADSVNPDVLQAALAKHREIPRNIVLACRTEAAARLCEKLSAIPVRLTRLSPPQAKAFVVERASAAGREDLFAPAALDRLVEAGGGSAQALRALAGMAMFLAAYSEAPQIQVADVEEAVRSQSGALSVEPAANDAAVMRSPIEEPAPAAAEPILDLSAADELPLVAVTPVLVTSDGDRRGVFRRFPSRRQLAAAAVLLFGIAIPGFVSFSQPNRTSGVTLASVTPPAVIRPLPRSEPDRLRALENVARAVMPGPIVLDLVTLGPLPRVSMPAVQRAARPQPKRAQGRVAAAALPAPVVSAPPSETPVPEARTAMAPEVRPLAPELRARLATAPEDRPLAPEQLQAVNAGAPRAPSVALPPEYMSGDAMALALLDIAEQAGLKYDGEFPGFRSCVYRSVSPGGAEHRLFWKAVEQCLRG